MPRARARGAPRDAPRPRPRFRRRRSELVVTLAPLALRAAFSNIAAWTTLQADLALAGQVRRRAEGGWRALGRTKACARADDAAPRAACAARRARARARARPARQCVSGGLGVWPPRPDIQAAVLAMRGCGAAWPSPPSGWAAEFRRSSLRCSAQAAALVVMLCDDKPHSFGAPDVLQLVARGVGAVAAAERRIPGAQPERAARLYVEGGLGANILNNSSSKWEVLLEPWPLLANMSDPINPLSRADRML